MTKRITSDKFVNAAQWSGWNMSFFGQPKMTIRCGECYYVFSTRDYLPVTGKRQHAAVCPACTYWNVMDFYFD